jgi:hypothetical protein
MAHRIVDNRVMSHVVLDPGPIPLEALERFDDPDVDTALDHEGIDFDTASFRLVEIDLRRVARPRPTDADATAGLMRTS